MDLGIGEMGFIFCGQHPRGKDSSERSRALGPSFGRPRKISSVIHVFHSKTNDRNCSN